jgi:hypothetical protein
MAKLNPMQRFALTALNDWDHEPYAAHYDVEYSPAGDATVRCYHPNPLPLWDGKSLKVLGDTLLDAEKCLSRDSMTTVVAEIQRRGDQAFTDALGATGDLYKALSAKADYLNSFFPEEK